MKDDKVEKYNPKNHNCPSTLIMKHPCNQVSSGGKVQYIRRDVVIDAMNEANKNLSNYTGCILGKPRLDLILNDAIEDANMGDENNERSVDK